MPSYDPSVPWNLGVKGTQVLPLINDDAPFIRVEAGPGTGKTFGLVRRVMRILHPAGLGVSGRKVAVVAFNRVIAVQLHDEVMEALKNSPHDQPPVIQTVHGFCLRVIGQNIRILLPHERDAMLYDVVQNWTRCGVGRARRLAIAESAGDRSLVNRSVSVRGRQGPGKSGIRGMARRA